jgi:predicted acyltransferase
MRRERALKVVLVLVGLVFSAGVLPVTDSLWHQNPSMYTFDMMLSLYVALGVFLLIAARNPSAKLSSAEGRVAHG